MFRQDESISENKLSFNKKEKSFDSESIFTLSNNENCELFFSDFDIGNLENFILNKPTKAPILEENRNLKITEESRELKTNTSIIKDLNINKSYNLINNNNLKHSTFSTNHKSKLAEAQSGYINDKNQKNVNNNSVINSGCNNDQYFSASENKEDKQTTTAIREGGDGTINHNKEEIKAETSMNYMLAQKIKETLKIKNKIQDKKVHNGIVSNNIKSFCNTNNNHNNINDDNDSKKDLNINMNMNVNEQNTTNFNNLNSNISLTTKTNIIQINNINNRPSTSSIRTNDLKSNPLFKGKVINNNNTQTRNNNDIKNIYNNPNFASVKSLKKSTKKNTQKNERPINDNINKNSINNSLLDNFNIKKSNIYQIKIKKISEIYKLLDESQYKYFETFLDLRNNFCKESYFGKFLKYLKQNYTIDDIAEIAAAAVLFFEKSVTSNNPAFETIRLLQENKIQKIKKEKSQNKNSYEFVEISPFSNNPNNTCSQDNSKFHNFNMSNTKYQFNERENSKFIYQNKNTESNKFFDSRAPDHKEVNNEKLLLLNNKLYNKYEVNIHNNNFIDSIDTPRNRLTNSNLGNKNDYNTNSNRESKYFSNFKSTAQNKIDYKNRNISNIKNKSSKNFDDLKLFNYTHLDSQKVPNSNVTNNSNSLNRINHKVNAYHTENELITKNRTHNYVCIQNKKEINAENRSNNSDDNDNTLSYSHTNNINPKFSSQKQTINYKTDNERISDLLNKKRLREEGDNKEKNCSFLQSPEPVNLLSSGAEDGSRLFCKKFQEDEFFKKIQDDQPIKIPVITDYSSHKICDLRLIENNQSGIISRADNNYYDAYYKKNHKDTLNANKTKFSKIPLTENEHGNGIRNNFSIRDSRSKNMNCCRKKFAYDDFEDDYSFPNSEAFMTTNRNSGNKLNNKKGERVCINKGEKANIQTFSEYESTHKQVHKNNQNTISSHSQDENYQFPPYSEHSFRPKLNKYQNNFKNEQATNQVVILNSPSSEYEIKHIQAKCNNKESRSSNPRTSIDSNRCNSIENSSDNGYQSYYSSSSKTFEFLGEEKNKTSNNYQTNPSKKEDSDSVYSKAFHSYSTTQHDADQFSNFSDNSQVSGNKDKKDTVNDENEKTDLKSLQDESTASDKKAEEKNNEFIGDKENKDKLPDDKHSEAENKNKPKDQQNDTELKTALAAKIIHFKETRSSITDSIQIKNEIQQIFLQVFTKNILCAENKEEYFSIFHPEAKSFLMNIIYFKPSEIKDQIIKLYEYEKEKFLYINLKNNRILICREDEIEDFYI